MGKGALMQEALAKAVGVVGKISVGGRWLGAATLTGY